MYKELLDGRDVFGADVVIVPDETHRNVAHRIQLKLGESVIATDEEVAAKKVVHCLDSAQKIATKFVSRQKEAEEAYSRSKIPLVRIVNYLATTRNITPTARTCLTSAGIEVLDKKFLRDHVWPTEIEALGSPFS